MVIEFRAVVWYWKGPAPHYFVTVPPEDSNDIREVARFVTYGWGMVPVSVRIGGSEWTTALFPKDGAYALPLKLKAREREGIQEGDEVRVRIEVRSPQ